MAATNISPGTRQLADGLGWFSIGLGVLELVAARPLARAMGMEDRSELLRLCGARELTTGVGILTQSDPTPWLWGRVGGDALDLATLAGGLDGDNPRRGKVGLAMAAVAGIAALDVICARALTRERARPALPMRDYGRRVGLPRPPAQMRGAAGDFVAPRDFRIPEPLRPWSA